MPMDTSAASCWPARLAYAAAGLFTLTSAATNALYGFRKGADLSTSLIWLAVSIAASIVFALSVPALLQSLSTKKWTQALLACIGFAVCGTYSFVAALGSASGGRQDSARIESTQQSVRARAQAAYDKATADLEAIKPARPAAEVEALIAGAKPVCRIVVTIHRRDTVCNPPPALTAELGRAKRRSELERKIETAQLELAAPATRQANSDAVAIAAYLSALGWAVEADTLNRLLALLAVLVIELGGGASLAIGMALSAGEPRLVADKRSAENDHGAAAGRGETRRQAAVVQCPQPVRNAPCAQPTLNQTENLATARISGSAGGRTQGDPPARLRLLDKVATGQGVLRTSLRTLSTELGVSQTRARQLLAELVSAGAVKVRSSATGTVVSLVTPAAA